MKLLGIVAHVEGKTGLLAHAAGRNYPLPVRVVPLRGEVGVRLFYRSTSCTSCRCRMGKNRCDRLWRRCVPALELRPGQPRFDTAIAAAGGADAARFHELPLRGAPAESGTDSE